MASGVNGGGGGGGGGGGDEESLSSSFERLLHLYEDITSDHSTPTTDPKLQARIDTVITGLIRTTVVTSHLGVFSTNETFDDLTNTSVKLLLLPALLGLLTLKQTHTERLEALRVASVYLRDYLKRCLEYGVVEERFVVGVLEEEEEEEEDGDGGGGKGRVGRPVCQEEIKKMAEERNEKIKRYREKVDAVGRVEKMRKIYEERKEDDEFVFEFWKAVVGKFAYECRDELQSVKMELKMLKQMARLRKKQGQLHQHQPPPQCNKEDPTLVQKMSVCQINPSSAGPTHSHTHSHSHTHTHTHTLPLNAFLISRGAAQNNVFGLGYPSHPSLTVEEFYDQRVREGWFPAPRSVPDRGCLQERARQTPEQEAARREEEEAQEERREEEDDEGELERRRERDEWRDTHRRGWGNTYNRS